MRNDKTPEGTVGSFTCTYFGVVVELQCKENLDLHERLISWMVLNNIVVVVAM